MPAYMHWKEIHGLGTCWLRILFQGCLASVNCPQIPVPIIAHIINFRLCATKMTWLDILMVAEKESQRKELAQRCDSLEARLAPLDADKAELKGKLQGVEKRLKEADKARADFEWRSR